MAKRFTDTEKWKKHFFRHLDPRMKLLWMYMLDDCDITGLWHQDLEIASIRIGADIEEEDALEAFKDQIVVIDNGEKWFIRDFMYFQYGPEMSKKNNIYKSIKKILDKYDLYPYLTVNIVGEGTTTSSKRSRLSQKAKENIIFNDEMTCQYCQDQKPSAELVVDHIVPLHRGGDNEDYNLITSCVRCNSHKTDLHPIDFINRNHDFLKITEDLKKRVRGAIKELKAPYKNLEGGKDKDKDTVKDKGKVKDEDAENSENLDEPKHKPDSLKEVVRFFGQNGGSELEAREFYDHYEMQGWVRGNGVAILSWKAAASKWIRKERHNPPDWKNKKNGSMVGVANAKAYSREL